LSLRNLNLFDGAKLIEADVVQEVGPALRSLRGFDELDQGEAAAQLLKGADPMGSVEDEAAIPL
jgi:hypothetical protein